MQEIVIENNIDINSMIYEVREKQVMLDSDLAKLYQCKNGTKEINKAVKRNVERFPSDFYFQLNQDEYYTILRFQNGTLELKQGGYAKYLPYVFTEQGVAMLATVIHTASASITSVNIMRTFALMRKFINGNHPMFERLITVEYKLLDHDSKINELFNIFDNKKVSTSKIFFEGEIYDAYSLLVSIIKEAKHQIIIIDNYIDDSILDILINKNDKVSVLIVTKEKSIQKLSVDKFNKQYKNLEIKISNTFHDRFLIIDNSLYHIGASLKDLGNKCFCISKIKNISVLQMLLEDLCKK